MVCGDTSNGVGPLQHIPGVPVLAAGPGGGWCGLLHPLLGPHHWQRHVLCPAGQYLHLVYCHTDFDLIQGFLFLRILPACSVVPCLAISYDSCFAGAMERKLNSPF